MDKLSMIKTVIPKLDERLGGGFLKNSVVLISRQTASRFTEFSNWNLLDFKGEKFLAVLIDYDRPVEEYINFALELQFKEEEVKNYIANSSLDNVKIINGFSNVFEDEKHLFEDKIHTLDESFNTDKLYSVMRTVREGVSKDTWVFWVFDSLTGLAIGISENELAKFFGRVIRLHKKYGDIAFYIVNMEAHTPQFLAIVTHLVDTVINFKVEETEERLKNYIQVVKSPLLIDTTKLYYEVHRDGSVIFY
nr:ATPase domain-containing protein [Candidatus Freyarchaeota archaeon]